MKQPVNFFAKLTGLSTQYGGPSGITFIKGIIIFLDLSQTGVQVEIETDKWLLINAALVPLAAGIATGAKGPSPMEVLQLAADIKTLTR